MSLGTNTNKIVSLHIKKKKVTLNAETLKDLHMYYNTSYHILIFDWSDAVSIRITLTILRDEGL